MGKASFTSDFAQRPRTDSACRPFNAHLATSIQTFGSSVKIEETDE
jgi:hypothetical protein